jgi:hypothetical protein
MADIRHSPPIEEHPELHEQSDVNIRALVYTGIGTGVFLVISFYLMLLIFNWFAKDQDRANESRNLSGLKEDIKHSAPLVPLQGMPLGTPAAHPNTPAQDTIEMFNDNRKLWTTYGTTNEAGFVRIPVERAMDLALERGVFKTATQPTTPGGPPRATR